MVREPAVFDDSDRNEILSCESLEHKWLKVVEIAICNAYKIDKKDIKQELFCIEKNEIEIPNTFTKDEENEVLSHVLISEMWETVYEIAKKKNYKFEKERKRAVLKKILKADKTNEQIKLKISKTRDLIANKLDFTPKTMFLELQSLITKDLSDAFTVRNKIAHGQWKHAFENDIKKFSDTYTKEIRTENIVVLQQKKTFFRTLSELIEILCRNPNKFKNSFDTYHKKIKNINLNILKRNYDSYKQKEIRKYKKGIIKKKLNSIITHFENVNANPSAVKILRHIYMDDIIEISELISVHP